MSFVRLRFSIQSAAALILCLGLGVVAWADPLEPERRDERDEQTGEEKSLKFHGEDWTDIRYDTISNFNKPKTSQ
jgi:hypothetical protein